MSNIKFEGEEIGINRTKLSTTVRDLNTEVDELEALGGKEEAPNSVNITTQTTE